MKKQKIFQNNIKVLSFIFIISIILVLIFYISSSEYKNINKIILPSNEITEEKLDIESEKNKNILSDIDINKGNVYDVIHSLNRPKEYRQLAEVTIFFGENSVVKKYKSYTKKNFTRIDAYKQNLDIDFTNIIGGGNVYTFRNGDNSYKEYKAADLTADDYQLIPTYEEISTEIIKTEIIDDLGEPCIVIYTENEKYTLSTITGLLIEAEYYKSNVLTRKVIVNNIDLTDIDDSLFILPGETLPLYN